MKPFDLEAAKRGDPIVTRNGRNAKFIAHAPESNQAHNVVVVIEGSIEQVTILGEANQGYENNHDLFMAPKKRTVWVNLYPQCHASYFDSEESAFVASQSWYVHRIGGKAYPVEIEE